MDDDLLGASPDSIVEGVELAGQQPEHLGPGIAADGRECPGGGERRGAVFLLAVVAIGHDAEQGAHRDPGPRAELGDRLGGRRSNGWRGVTEQLREPRDRRGRFGREDGKRWTPQRRGRAGGNRQGRPQRAPAAG